MDKNKKIIPLKDLNLTDRFLFDEVLEDPRIHQEVLSIIFGKEVPLIDTNETEKELRVSPLLRTIRMESIHIRSKQNVRKFWDAVWMMVL